MPLLSAHHCPVLFGNMKFACPSKGLEGLVPRRTWLLVFAAIVVVVVLTWSRRVPKSIAIDICLNTNGIATVFGVPLGNGSVRDLTLLSLSRGHVPVRVIVPSGGSATPGWDTNAPLTMGAIIRAGFIPTKKRSGPSPYE